MSDTQDFRSVIPASIRKLGSGQELIPALAKDAKKVQLLREAAQSIETKHTLVNQDSRTYELPKNSIHLALTSPPYWTLKQYNDGPGQLGHVVDYEEFLNEIDKIWKNVFHGLVPGGRLICVVGDVCLSRRKNAGEHTVIPLHASIQEHARSIGFSNVAPIIWHKISNAQFEVSGGGGFLGKPYEPNGVIKNDIEYILMLRKPGGYRKPTMSARLLSLISESEHKKWFQQIWTGVTGASTMNHPAPYPVELAERLIRMFSFVGDTVYDPFMGSGTTNLTAAQCTRNSIGVEIDVKYYKDALKRMKHKSSGLFDRLQLEQIA